MDRTRAFGRSIRDNRRPHDVGRHRSRLAAGAELAKPRPGRPTARRRRKRAVTAAAGWTCTATPTSRGATPRLGTARISRPRRGRRAPTCSASAARARRRSGSASTWRGAPCWAFPPGRGGCSRLPRPDRAGALGSGRASPPHGRPSRVDRGRCGPCRRRRRGPRRTRWRASLPAGDRQPPRERGKAPAKRSAGQEPGLAHHVLPPRTTAAAGCLGRRGRCSAWPAAAVEPLRAADARQGARERARKRASVGQGCRPASGGRRWPGPRGGGGDSGGRARGGTARAVGDGAAGTENVRQPDRLGHPPGRTVVSRRVRAVTPAAFAGPAWSRSG